MQSLGKVRVQIVRGDESVEADIDLNPNRFTLQEAVRVEEQLGTEKAERLFSGEEVSVLPSMLRVIVWAKLQTVVPDLGLEDFDLELASAMVEEGDVIELSRDDMERALFAGDGDLDEARKAAEGKR